MEKTRKHTIIVAGWREWIALPELGIARLKAKIDTGARTSALHAFSIKPYKKGGQHRVRFNVHPMQQRMDTVVTCEAEIYDMRWVMDSGGHRERRYVIQTALMMNNHSWPVEITLTNRDSMRFRMLLGRTAMKNCMLVVPGESYLSKNV